MIKKKKVVNDFEKSSQTYFNEISKFNPLSREEEYSLWERYRKHNDMAARDKLITSNLKFVASVAKCYQGLGLSYADLIAEGNYGFMKAMEKFDYEKGFKTISYSVWWIKQSILDALERRNGIEGDSLPEEYENQSVDSEDDDSSSDVAKEYMDNSPLTNLDSESGKQMLKILLNCLTDRERDVISSYFGLDGRKIITLEEIGKKLGLTKERVRQIKERALKKLRSEALNYSFSIETLNE